MALLHSKLGVTNKHRWSPASGLSLLCLSQYLAKVGSGSSPALGPGAESRPQRGVLRGVRSQETWGRIRAHTVIRSWTSDLSPELTSPMKVLQKLDMLETFFVRLALHVNSFLN